MCESAFDVASMVSLNGGAMLFAAKRSSPSEAGRVKSEVTVRGFFEIQVLGPMLEEGKGRAVSLFLARDTVNGQFSFEFCSTGCLRQFLVASVDEIERRRSAPEYEDAGFFMLGGAPKKRS
jgi:hypothetical protein